MNLRDLMPREITQTQKDKYGVNPLQEIPGVIKFIETKVEWGWGGELVFKRYRISVNAFNCTLISG